MSACAGGSSNGRTPGSGPGNGGSSPPPPAIFVSAQRDAEHDAADARPAPSSRGLGHGPLKAETRVRIPLGPPPNSCVIVPSRNVAQCMTVSSFPSNVYALSPAPWLPRFHPGIRLGGAAVTSRPFTALHLHKPFGFQLSTAVVAGFVASCRTRVKFRRISVPVA